MPQAQPQYVDPDTGNPIPTPDTAVAQVYVDPVTGNPLAPTSVAEQARKRLASRGLTPEAVKGGQGVVPNDFSTMGELQDPKNFPTTGEVLGSVGTHALGAVKSLLPHVPTSPADAALSMVDPTGTVRSTVDAVRGAGDTYHSEIARGNNPIVAGGRAAATLIPGGSTMNALTEPIEAAAHNRPVSKQENVDAAGGVGDIGGNVALGAAAHAIAPHLPSGGGPSGPTPALDSLDASVGSDIGTPAEPPYDTTKHGDIVNRAIGQGAVDGKRGINVGKAFVDAGETIDPAEVKKNPRALIAHTNKVIGLENTAADQLLQSPEAQQPIANGDALTKDVGTGVAIVDAADARAAKAVKTYVDRRIGELSAAHGGDGMLSIADTDTLKRELQNRANYDKIFGNTSLTSAGNLRNQLLADYARSLDSVGDTLSGYRELNDRRASLVNFRDNTLYPIVDAQVQGTNIRPSKLGSVVRIGANAVRGNPLGVVEGAADLAASQRNIPNPVKIAKAINQQVNAARAAGADFPTQKILAAPPLAASEIPPLAPPTEIKPPATFASSEHGDVFPIDQRPGHVAASFPPDGQTTVTPPHEPSDVVDTARIRAAATQAQSNPGFDPNRLPTSASGPPPVAPPVSHIDLANTLRGVSSAPGELNPSLLESTGSSAPGQIGQSDIPGLVERAGNAQSLASTLRDAARNRPAGVTAPPLVLLPADLQAALNAQRARDAAAALRPPATSFTGPMPIGLPETHQQTQPAPDEGASGMLAYTPRPMENDHMVQTVPPRDYLPERFKNAKSAMMGTPFRSGATDTGTDRGMPEASTSVEPSDTPSGTEKIYNPGWDGLYGRNLNPPNKDDGSNSILVSKNTFSNPATAKTAWARTLAHETGHAVWTDLTPNEQQGWTALHNKISSFDTADTRKDSQEPPKHTTATLVAQRYGMDPNESFAELWAQYVVRPSEMKAEDPQVYAFMKKIAGGKEYIQPKKKSEASLPNGMPGTSLADTIRSAATPG